jgi:hypothetical protein
MLKLISGILVLGLASFTAVVLADPPDEGQGRYKATLSGLEEVPAVVAPGTGEATAWTDTDGITVQLKYSGLTGTPNAIVLQLGQRGANGSVVANLCGGTAKTCAAGPSGEIEATIAAKDVLAAPAQGIEAGKIEPVLTALDEGVIYINVPTSKFLVGEIRGQLVRGFRGNGEDNGKDKDDKEKDDKTKGN